MSWLTPAFSGPKSFDVLKRENSFFLSYAYSTVGAPFLRYSQGLISFKIYLSFIYDTIESTNINSVKASCFTETITEAAVVPSEPLAKMV